jgi:hypothetical protein
MAIRNQQQYQTTLNNLNDYRESIQSIVEENERSGFPLGTVRQDDVDNIMYLHRRISDIEEAIMEYEQYLEDLKMEVYQ